MRPINFTTKITKDTKKIDHKSFVIFVCFVVNAFPWFS